MITSYETEVNSADARRLLPHLTGWNKLNEILLLDPGESDLLKLLKLEMGNQRRLRIIRKLVSRVNSLRRDRLLSLCSKKNSKPKS